MEEISVNPKKLQKELNQVKGQLGEARGELRHYTKLRELYRDLLTKNQQNVSELAYCRQETENFSREKDIVHGDLLKARDVISKLESFCQTLQQRNKKLILEAQYACAEVKAEENKRQTLATQFQTSVDEIGRKRDDLYESLRAKFEAHLEEFENKEKLFSAKTRTFEIEQQLAEARFQEVQAKKEIAEKQNEIYVKTIEQLENAEGSARGQLESYLSKFEEIQGSILDSNNLFADLQAKLREQRKENEQLTKENSRLLTACKTNSEELLKVAREKIEIERAVLSVIARKDSLEKLCRTLQSERSHMAKRMAELELAHGEHERMVAEQDDVIEEAEEGESTGVAEETDV